MEEYFADLFFFAFFYWPIYLIVAILLLFFVYKFWRKKATIMKLLLAVCGLIGVMILLPALYVLFMTIYGAIINI